MDAAAHDDGPVAVRAAHLAGQDGRLARWASGLVAARWGLTLAAAAALAAPSVAPPGPTAGAAPAAIVGGWLAGMTLLGGAARWLRGARRSAAARLQHLRLGRARARLDWRALAELGAPPPASPPPNPTAAQPLADNLDLDGPRGLAALWATAPTFLGEGTLRSWALAGAPVGMAEAQAVVRELGGQAGLREAWAVEAARDGVRPLDPAALARWAEGLGGLPVGWSRRLRWRLGACHAVLAATAALAWAGWPGALVVGIAVQLVAGILLGPEVARVLGQVGALEQAWAPLARRLAQLEALPVRAAAWRAALACLTAPGPGPSARATFRALGTSSRLAAAGRQLLWAPWAVVGLWRPHAAAAAAAHLGAARRRLGDWLGAVGALEAWVLAGGYAAEHPESVYPSLLATPAGDGPAAGELRAEGLRHPLLATAVGNDLQLGPRGWGGAIAGANMSGKSTLLRAAGLAAVMAPMGLPVAARRLAISCPLRPATVLRVADDLADGRSRFWAEAQAMAAVVAAAARGPTLFLLDEPLSGTNGEERAEGMRAILRLLREHGAVGLISSHDAQVLAEGERAGMWAAHLGWRPDARGQPELDYRLRPGAAGPRNALALLRRAGLPL